MRNRLIESLFKTGMVENRIRCSIIADEILADGWVRPPCKVGDTVYVISRYYTGFWKIYKCNIDSITIYEKNTFLSMSAKGKYTFGEEVSQIGKNVFFTREAANQKLKGGGQE